MELVSSEATSADCLPDTKCSLLCSRTLTGYPSGARMSQVHRDAEVKVHGLLSCYDSQ